MILPVPSAHDLLRIAPLLGVGLVASILLVTWRLISAMIHPPRRSYSWAVAHNQPGDPGEVSSDPPRFDEFTFAGVRERELPAWTIHNDADPQGPTVVITHGWGESRVTSLPVAVLLLPHVGRVVLWDMPGHGDAKGISRLGATEPDDLLRLLDSLAGPDFDDRPIVLCGSSMGAGVSIAAAARTRDTRLAGVIAEGVSRTIHQPARRILQIHGQPWRVAGRLSLAYLALAFGRPGRLDCARYAAELSVPLLILHGSEDRVCSADDGRAIADAAQRGRFVELSGAGHDDARDACCGPYIEAIRSLLADAVLRYSPSPTPCESSARA